MKPPTPTTLDYALLGLLHLTPSSGYDLRKVLTTTAMGYLSGSPGTIYPALKRLKRQGLIEGEVDRTQSLRPRQLYRPTAAGTEIFRGWLSREVTREDMVRGDQLMLRFAYHSFLDNRRASREFLVGVAREVAAFVEELEEQHELYPPAAPVHGRLALEHGIEQFRATGRWAQKSLKHFQDEEP